ncbi:MFS general substrate transporter [Hypoxylon fuscum]|nr:MFS general substrate transporter [Hypoxylon fuscum]
MFWLNWLVLLPIPITITNTRPTLAAMTQDTENETDTNSSPPSKSEEGNELEEQRPKSEVDDDSHGAKRDGESENPGGGTDDSNRTLKPNEELPKEDPKEDERKSISQGPEPETGDADQVQKPEGRLEDLQKSGNGTDDRARDEPGGLTQITNEGSPSTSTPKEDGVEDGIGNGIAAITLPLSDLNNDVVGWESQDDPKMPLNFSATRKWVIVWALAAITFMSPFSSSVLAPAIEYINKEFHNTNPINGPFPVSIYLLGYATGPLFLAPLSEIFGRAGVLTLSNVFFCVWHIGCALSPSVGFLIAFRFSAGVGGSGCMTLGGAIIGDLFPIEKRGVALSIWALGPLIGPTVGPLVGAFIAGSIGWRWSFWIVLIPSAVITIILATFLPETNHKVLMQRKTKRLSKELNRSELKTCYEARDSRKVTQLTILRTGMMRPLKMLIFAPMIFIQSLYVSFIYGSVYLMYNSIPPTFASQYGWDTGISGLVFISIGLGYMVGLWAFSMLSDRTVVRLTKANGGAFKPEFRLTVMIWYSFLCPLAFFWYGWAAETRTHWIVPIMGLFPLGFGVIGVFMPTQAYIIDAYPSYAASGIAAFTVLRSVIAAFLPLCGPVLFDNLGIGWGSSVLGFVGVAMIPVPIFIFKFGAWLREKYPLKL